MNEVNDFMNGVMAGLARLDVWVLVFLLIYIAVAAGKHLLRQAARVATLLKPLVLSRFPSVPEPRTEPFVSVQKPNASRSSDAAEPAPEKPAAEEPNVPSVYDVLAVLIQGEVISTTKAYELLGVTRGASQRYQNVRAKLEAARLKIGRVATYQELDAQRRATGRYVTRHNKLRS